MLHEFPKHHNPHAPPPAHDPGTSKPGRVRAHPDAVWDMLVAAETSSSSLAQVIEQRRKVALEVSVRQASRWEHLYCAMYHHRTALAWPHTNHLCLSADSSTHSYEDTLLGLGYSWELNQTCFPNLQILVPGMTCVERLSRPGLRHRTDSHPLPRLRSVFSGNAVGSSSEVFPRMWPGS